MRNLSFILLFALLAVGPACTSVPPEAQAAEPPRAVPVRLAAVERGNISHPVHSTGVVRFKTEADLSFKVGGVVSAVLVEAGATVKRGQVLAKLDPTEVSAALAQAEESRTKAERDLARVRRLHDTGAVAVVERDNAETGLAMARAAAAAAAFNAAQSVIVATDDGRIDRRFVEPGEVVAPGRPIFHVSGKSRGAIVRVGLTDRDAMRVSDGDAAKVVLDVEPGRPLVAHVTQIATVASPGLGTFDVEVTLDEPPPRLLSGLTAKVDIARVEQGAAIPLTALTEGQKDDAVVFTVRDNRAQRVPVKVLFLDGTRAVVEDVPAANEVVSAGAHLLAEGSLVRAVQ